MGCNSVWILVALALAAAQECSSHADQAYAPYVALDPRPRDADRAREYFKRAASSSGDAALLALLAAFANDPSDFDLLYNVVANSLAAGYTSLARDYAASAMSIEDAATLRALIEAEGDALDERAYVEHLSDDELVKEEAHSLFTIDAFPTRVSGTRLDISAEVAREYREAVMRAYTAQHKPTQANHAFFDAQMRHLKATKLNLFSHTALHDLLDFEARRFAFTYLTVHLRHDAETARRKIAHDLVQWASVHLNDSVHEPHVTKDALLGGVFYLDVPDKSGKLRFFDPRGTRFDAPAELSAPPFAHSLDVEPTPNLLVLFPGWLVHTVTPSRNYDVPRISISLSLKGDWMDAVSVI